MKLRRIALAAAAAAALALAGGAVYLKLAGPGARLRAAGGREVFREAATVNGLAGTLRVYAMPPAPDGAHPALRIRFPAQPVVFPVELIDVHFFRAGFPSVE